MLDLAPEMLRDAIRMVMRQEKHNHAEVAALARCNEQSIKNFLRGATASPIARIREGMEEYLQAYGMTRQKIMDGIQERKSLEMSSIQKTDVDEQQLEKMGIKDPGVMTSARPGRHYLCAFLSDWETALVVGSIMNANNIPEETKKNLLGKLFVSEFPTLLGNAKKE